MKNVTDISLADADLQGITYESKDELKVKLLAWDDSIIDITFSGVKCYKALPSDVIANLIESENGTEFFLEIVGILETEPFGNKKDLIVNFKSFQLLDINDTVALEVVAEKVSVSKPSVSSV